MTTPDSSAAQEFRDGDVIVLPPFTGPDATWLRISRGWINGYGSEVTAPWTGETDAVLLVRDGKVCER